MNKNILLISIVTSLVLPQQAMALNLIADVLAAGAQAVIGVGGAVISKATEDTPEQEAAKRKKTEETTEENFKKMFAEVEAAPKLTPLEREYRKLSLNGVRAKTMEFLAGQAERDEKARKARADAVTGTGILKTAGDSAFLVANKRLQTEAAIKDAEVASHYTRAMSQAKRDSVTAEAHDFLGQRRRPTSIAQTIGTGITGGPIASVTPEQQNMANGLTNIMQEKLAEANKIIDFDVTNGSPVPAAMSDDKSHKVAVEFAGSAKAQEEIKAALKAAGYNVVEADADITYQFSGDYAIASNTAREGLKMNAADIIEGKEVTPPAKKSALVNGMKSAFLAIATGAKAPSHNEIASTAYEQHTLIVLNRHAADGDSRTSSLVSGQSNEIQAGGMVQMALRDLIEKITHPIQEVVLATK